MIAVIHVRPTAELQGTKLKHIATKTYQVHLVSGKCGIFSLLTFCSIGWSTVTALASSSDLFQLRKNSEGGDCDIQFSEAQTRLLSDSLLRVFALWQLLNSSYMCFKPRFHPSFLKDFKNLQYKQCREPRTILTTVQWPVKINVPQN